MAKRETCSVSLRYFIKILGNCLGFSLLAVASAVAVWVKKFGYWRFIDNFTHAAMVEAATGIGQFGRVSKFEGAHMCTNYMLKQKGYLLVGLARGLRATTDPKCLVPR